MRAHCEHPGGCLLGGLLDAVVELIAGWGVGADQLGDAFGDPHRHDRRVENLGVVAHHVAMLVTQNLAALIMLWWCWQPVDLQDAALAVVHDVELLVAGGAGCDGVGHHVATSSGGSGGAWRQVPTDPIGPDAALSSGSVSPW